MAAARTDENMLLKAVSPGEYTQAMGQHVSSVCVITTAIDQQRYGLTATAVSSVCAQPPRLLACVNKSSFTHANIAKAGCFCVNVLSETQDVVAKRSPESWDRKSIVLALGGGP